VQQGSEPQNLFMKVVLLAGIRRIRLHSSPALYLSSSTFARKMSHLMGGFGAAKPADDEVKAVFNHEAVRMLRADRAPSIAGAEFDCGTSALPAGAATCSAGLSGRI